MKNICILGSTGSIGKTSLEVIENFPDRFRAAYLTAYKNTDLLLEQIERYRPLGVVVLDEASAETVRSRVNGSARVYGGSDGLLELVRNADYDILLSSLVGFAGLAPTIEAIRRGKTIALANKEILVVAGEIVTALARRYGASLVPIDSEHSAILQCLAGEASTSVERLILTASGGPFLRHRKDQFESFTVAEALNHPNWKMGNKITIDSATMMNKGLEVIEARWLFNIPAEKIDVVIHPQSMIHSMVQFVDGSVKAQLGIPDMKIPIQYALTFPERVSSRFERLDFNALAEMTFEPPDVDKFECLSLAYEAIATGGTAPAILNAANEVAVDLFLNQKISFPEIPSLIRNALRCIRVTSSPSLEQITESDAEAREFILSEASHLT